MEKPTWPSLHTIPQRPKSHPRLLHFCSCYSPILKLCPLLSPPPPTLLFLLPRPPSLPLAICPPPYLPPLPIVSPSHLLSTPAVSLLAASHWDHIAAEVWRLSQWSVAHKGVHIPHGYCFSYSLLSIILSPTFSHPFLIISLECSQIGFN